MSEEADLTSLVHIMNCETKKELETYCRSVVIKRRDFAMAVQVALLGGFSPYKYASHFSRRHPAHLVPTDADHNALFGNEVGELSKSARKTVSKISYLIKEQRVFAAHLFYTEDYEYWFAFYFDQRDTADPNLHWVGGPHIHLISYHWPRLDLEKVWSHLQSGQANFSSKIHLRYSTKADR